MTTAAAKSKLIRSGADYALTLPEEMIASLDWTPGEPLSLHVINGQIVIEATDPDRAQRFQKALDETNAQYASALKRLAE